ncbi:hypothetical protein RUM43_013964 [Polyplax serrata]|uniref:Uncharacterized protein n=1 Tax=Polyplax serrata TaxID=468196 RepID=A0AAN8PBF4_POLSC
MTGCVQTSEKFFQNRLGQGVRQTLASYGGMLHLASNLIMNMLLQVLMYQSFSCIIYNIYFSSNRNGFPPSLDPRFGSFKSGAATPFVGLMAPLSTTAVSPSSQQSTTASTSPSDHQRHLSKSQADVFTPNFGVPGLNGLNPFAGGNINSLFPPMIDMSSTQALLSMVRTASAQNQAQLESYLKGASHVHAGKRPNETSPLDLSSAGAVTPVSNKKAKKEAPKDGLYENILNLPLLEALRTKELTKISTKNRSISPNLVQKKNLQNSLNNLQNTISTLNVARTSPNRVTGSPRCSSLCGSDGRACAESEGQSIAHWTVDDVCSFVSSIDICAEYEKVRNLKFKMSWKILKICGVPSRIEKKD